MKRDSLIPGPKLFRSDGRQDFRLRNFGNLREETPSPDTPSWLQCCLAGLGGYVERAQLVWERGEHELAAGLDE